MPNIGDAFPSKFLKASDLKGKPAKVTISKVVFEPVGQTKEMKAVVYFKGAQKGLVLNKTNSNRIVAIIGSPITEEWPGHPITIYPTDTEYQGESVECIRVKTVPGQAAVIQGMDKSPAKRRVAAPEPDAFEEASEVEDNTSAFDDDDSVPF
jgi:hypothetical protein